MLSKVPVLFGTSAASVEIFDAQEQPLDARTFPLKPKDLAEGIPTAEYQDTFIADNDGTATYCDILRRAGARCNVP